MGIWRKIMEPEKTALVLGASGGIGGEVARQMCQAGWRVRALKRGLGVPEQHESGIHWVRGDALRAQDVAAAAAGCGVIVHAVNPPGYRRWSELVLPMLDHTIAAARTQRATIVLPGNVYNYGPETFPLIAEDAPQHPLTRKGAIRVEMERRLEAAAEEGAARVLIVRAGDFFGPRSSSNWFSQGMVKSGRPVVSIQLPGPGVAHQFAYLPDVAQTVVQLLARRQTLPAFARFHMAGHWDPDGRTLGRAVKRVVRRQSGTEPVLKTFPWWLLRLVSPVVPTLRELMEMRYLWIQPLRLDNRRLVDMLGAEPHTPLDAAIEATLESMGCLGRAIH